MALPPLPPHLLDQVDPVGMAGIAERLHVTRQSVVKWRKRETNPMPEPDWMVSGSPVWHWPHVHDWHLTERCSQ